MSTISCDSVRNPAIASFWRVPKLITLNTIFNAKISDLSNTEQEHESTYTAGTRHLLRSVRGVECLPGVAPRESERARRSTRTPTLIVGAYTRPAPPHISIGTRSPKGDGGGLRFLLWHPLPTHLHSEFVFSSETMVQNWTMDWKIRRRRVSRVVQGMRWGV